MRATYTIVSIAIMAYLAFGGARQIIRAAGLEGILNRTAEPPKISQSVNETKKVSPSNDKKPVKRVYEY